MRLTASIESGAHMLDVALHQPFEAVAHPTTRSPSSRARIVAAPMTLLMPGAGPPPTRIASFLCCSISSFRSSALLSKREHPEPGCQQDHTADARAVETEPPRHRLIRNPSPNADSRIVARG